MADTVRIVKYNGVTYVYNSVDKYLDLGDMMSEEPVLSLPLSTDDKEELNPVTKQKI